MAGYKQIKADLKKISDPDKANLLARFFKTGKGEYGEGDVFWGITVPEQRAIAKTHLDASLDDIKNCFMTRYMNAGSPLFLFSCSSIQKAVAMHKRI
jgi:hypothetical protein